MPSTIIPIKQSEMTNASYTHPCCLTEEENMQLESCSDVFKTKFSALHRAQTRFRKACIQLKLLNKQLTDMNDRYTRAKDDNFRCFRYNLRLKLAVIEGVRNMYYQGRRRVLKSGPAEETIECRWHEWGRARERDSPSR